MAEFEKNRLFKVILLSVNRPDKEFDTNTIRLKIVNLAVEELALQPALRLTFPMADIAPDGLGSTLITMDCNAEVLVDGASDGRDAEKYVEGIAEQIMAMLASFPGWGDDGNTMDLRRHADSLD